MARRTLIIKDFQGGIGTLGEKRDKVGSAKFTKGLDPYEDTSYVTTARKTTKKSSTTITGLPYWMEDGSPWTTDRYVYDSAGKIYRVTSADAVSALRTVSGGAGEGLKVFNDSLYYALGVNLGRYYGLSGTPTFNDDISSWWEAEDLTDTGGGTGQADYVPPTSISEVATARQTFTANNDPIKNIIIDVDDAGSGDWTLTVHNSQDDVVGEKIIVNGSMAVGDNTFTFASVLRTAIGNEYHFHVTSTVADGGVDTNVATDLEGAEYTITYGALIDTPWHPMTVIDNTDLIIGNEKYLARYDEAKYYPNQIQLDPGYAVRSIANFEEYIVVAAFKGTNVDDAEEAKLYFWDGISSSYNYSSPVTVGVPNAIFNTKGELVGVYGTKGNVHLGNTPFVKIIDTAPKLTKGKKIEIYPGAITEFEGRTLIGYAGNTDDGTNFEQGVYEFGRQAEGMELAFNYPIQISTGTTKATTVKIGLVKAIGNDLYVGWRDNATYGLDKIARGDSSVAAALYESLIFDNGDPDKEFLPLSLSVTYEALTTGQSVVPKYKYDRATSFTNGTTSSTVGETTVKEGLYVRCKEMEFGFNLASTSNTFQKVTAVKLEYDDLGEELED